MRKCGRWKEGILEGEGEAAARSWVAFVVGVKLTRLRVGERWSPWDGVPGMLGSALSSWGLFGERGRCVPLATLAGSSEYLWCGLWRIDFMLPIRESFGICLLRSSIVAVAGFASSLVDLERLRAGIFDACRFLTLAARASEALVGVVMTAGRPNRVVPGVPILPGASDWLSLETGRAQDVSSP